MSDNEQEKGLEEWMDREKMSRRRLLQGAGGLLGAAAAGPLMFTTEDTFADALSSVTNKSNLPYHANTSVKGTIEFWHFWSSPLRRGAIRTAIKQFNQHYPNVHVKDAPFPSPDIWTKNEAAVAAGKGMPDVIVSNRPTLYWDAGKHHVYDSLTTLVKKDRMSGKPFWPFTWAEATANGGTWGLPYETDCRVMFYNRAKLINAGLNSNSFPTTWSGLASIADKLDKKGSGPGGYDTITFSPYHLSSGQDLTSWVWNNKSDWQNSKQYPTVNNAKNIETALWMKKWVDRYGGPQTFTAVSSRNTDPAHNEFGNQYVATHVDIPGFQAVMNYYGIKFLPANGKTIFPYWGVTLAPHNTGGVSHSFSGGFSLSLPRNHHRSAGTTAASWEFIKFMTFVGQRTWAQLTNAIPTVESVAKHDTLLSAVPHWQIFMKAMALGHAANRNKWDDLFPGNVVSPAQDDIMNGSKSAKDALDNAQSQALQNMKRFGGP